MLQIARAQRRQGARRVQHCRRSAFSIAPAILVIGRGGYGLLYAVAALLADLVFLVIAEALVPSGSVPGPVYVLRAARGRMGRAGRYWQISRILARRGLMPYARGGRRSELATPEGRARLARSVRLAMEDGGVTFVKLGQVLSTLWVPTMPSPHAACEYS